jgi:hypothetical protein
MVDALMCLLEGTNMTDLLSSLLSEIERCAQLKARYDEIPSGAFGSLMIQQAIDNAKAAIASGDIVEMIRCLKTCEACE